MKYSFLFSIFLMFSWQGNSQTSACPQVINAIQNFCLVTQPTVSDLLPQDAVWYSAHDSITPLSASTPLVSSAFYYADNIEGTCGSRPQVQAYVYDDPDAGPDNFVALCDSDTSGLFPSLSAIENYYFNLLSPGVPHSGTFSPNVTQVLEDYHSEPIVGYKDFPRTYTVGAEGCQDSAVITVRVYEDVQAGIDTQITLFSTDPPITMLDSLGGNPSKGGTWSGLESGVFDPAIDTAGVYVYTVENALCGSSSASLTISVDQDGWSLPVVQNEPYSGFVGSNENYVITRSPRIAVSSMNEVAYNKEIIESITYYDGLGRPLQEVAIRGGGNKEDIVTPFVYDSYGRQVREYLPYADISLLGELHPNAVTNAEVFYNSAKYGLTLNPYSEKELEASPLNRLSKQAAPGEDWKLGSGHEIELAYQANGLDEVRMFSVTFNNSDTKDPLLNLDMTEFYAPGQLYKTIIRNENHSGTTKNHTTEEFKDKQGRVVLKRTYADVGAYTEVNHDTYYVYDDYGNLTYVLPPKLEASEKTLAEILADLDKLAYQYKYDHRNRLVEKKIPGKGWEYIVYNVLDQPVMTQDQLQREKTSPEWLYKKYDAFGRVTSTGIFTNTSIGTGREAMQEALNNYYSTSLSANVYETRSGTNYTNTSFPVQNLEVLTENFYDDYNFDKAGIVIPVSIFDSTVVEQQKVKGLATGSRVKVLGTAHFITTVLGYDYKGRNIWAASKNPFLDTEDIVEHELDFMGNTLETRTAHKKTGSSLVEIKDMFAYDHQNRLISHTQTINDGEEALISYNDYDELGQLTNKWVGGYFHIGDGPLQVVDYTYNIRGWLKMINNPNSLGNDLFGFEINYNDPQAGAMALFNGNISETHWKTHSVNSTNNPVSNQYLYRYDALNRITSAIDNTGNYDLGLVNYDKNGNITNLSRQGHTSTGAITFGNMDNLDYIYFGNQLTKVDDTGNKSYGFKDGANTNDDYGYDENGNMITDSNKGITSITYNYMNLPTNIDINGGNISYIYSASGVKQRKVAAGTTTDYAGNFIYKNGILKFFSHPEGYVEYENGSFNYIFQYNDHLGNIRLRYTDANGNGTIETGTSYSEIIKENNYYPFGLKHKGYNERISSLGSDAAKKYMFGGKELQDEDISGISLDWYDFGARNYDAALGRWMNVDPLAEEFTGWSPYSYVYNNPQNYTDSTGMCPDGDCPDPPTTVDGGELDEVVIIAYTKERTWTSETGDWDYNGTPEQYQQDYPEFKEMTDPQMQTYWSNNYSSVYSEWTQAYEGQMRLGAFINRFKFIFYDSGVLQSAEEVLQWSIGGTSAPFVGKGVISAAPKVMNGVKTANSLYKKASIYSHVMGNAKFNQFKRMSMDYLSQPLRRSNLGFSGRRTLMRYGSKQVNYFKRLYNYEHNVMNTGTLNNALKIKNVLSNGAKFFK